LPLSHFGMSSYQIRHPKIASPPKTTLRMVF
jgi:hypothetical protein